MAYADLLNVGDEVFLSHPAFVSRLGTGVASEPDTTAALYAEVRAQRLCSDSGVARPRFTAHQNTCTVLCAAGRFLPMHYGCGQG